MCRAETVIESEAVPFAVDAWPAATSRAGKLGSFLLAPSELRPESAFCALSSYFGRDRRRLLGFGRDGSRLLGVVRAGADKGQRGSDDSGAWGRRDVAHAEVAVLAELRARPHRARLILGLAAWGNPQSGAGSLTC